MTETNKPEANQPTWDSQAGTIDDNRGGNYPVGILAGLGAGLAAAAIYAVVAVLTDNEIGYLALLIGAAVALVIAGVGGRTNIVTGLIAAVIAALSFLVAIIATGAGLVSDMFGTSLMEGFEFIMEDPGTFLSAYFEDAMSYLFLVLAVAPAFYLASGLKKD